MKLIYGTNNQSKVNHMNNMLENIDINVIGLKDINKDINEPIEDGDTPLENAIIKAKSYYKQLKQPVYSTDSALYFEGVEKEDQPGVLIKRIHNQNLKGRDFTNYYASIAKKYGGKIKAYYKNAICLVMDEKTIHIFDGPSIHSEAFYIVDTPHPHHEEGFPLNALSVEITTGKYYNDLKNYKSKGSMDQGFITFFTSILSSK